MVFNNFCYLFWGQRWCCAKTSIIDYNFLYFTRSHCPQLFYCTSALSLFRRPCVVARRASTNHGTQQSDLMQKHRQNTNSLQLGGMKSAVPSHVNFCSTVQYVHFKIWEGVRPLSPPPLVTRLATNSDWHRRTGRHFTGRAEKVCPKNNNLP